MKSLSVKLGIILIGLAIFGYGEAIAFDVEGFKSGMSQKEVENLIRSMNFSKIDIGNNNISAFDIPVTNNSRIYQFVFKDNKLIHFKMSFPPSVNNFIFLFDKFISIYGQPVFSTPNIMLSSTGEMRVIRFTFFNNLSEPNIFDSVTEIIELYLFGESPKASLNVMYQAGSLK
ncbi:MAG: hypothetical protein ABSG71_20240 [Thermodesulfobacteriota bacterium]|jgi:hypothetical protein